jgi:penicillin G amidase
MLDRASSTHPVPRLLPWYRRWTWRHALLGCLALIGIALTTAAGLLHWRLTSSLPILDGQLSIQGIASQVTIERDALGVPSIRSQSRADTAFALGFLHAQDRFFQMDLLRRMSSGRIAELFGAAALPLDERFRKHRFQVVAAKVVEDLPAAHLAVLSAYTEGVNHGLDELGAPPFEFTLLRLKPKPWTTVDCIHVMLTMLCDLQPMDAEQDVALGLLRERVPPEVFDFLVRSGSSWDAAMDDSSFRQPSVPGENVWSLHTTREGDKPKIANSNTEYDSQSPISFLAPSNDPELRAASNNWAVTSELSMQGHAILSSDMHLGLRVPTVWYRALMDTPCLDGTRRRLVGVTLPGVPALVEGSNGSIAWGMTNSYGDFGDVIELKSVAGSENQYITPDGVKTVQRFSEDVQYLGGSKKIEYEWTVWGPVVANRNGKKFVHHWVGDDPNAIDTTLFELENAQSVEVAIDTCNRSGAPHLNVVIADRQGNIGWTLCGRIPQRSAPPTRVPADWSERGAWTGFLKPEAYPRLINPTSGRLWTANNRVVGGDMLAKIGDSGFDIGARAQQIRDRLMAKSKFDEKDMLSIQLDDEARFLSRWQLLLQKTIQENEQVISKELAKRVTAESLRASIDSIDYRIVRTFRSQVINRWFAIPGRENKNADHPLGAIAERTGIEIHVPMAFEDVVWQLLSEQPSHWLPKQYASWDELLRDALRSTELELSKNGPLSRFVWGEHNKAEIQHPLSMALPFLSSWLDMPNVSLPGDNHMPRVQRPGFGASQRLVVSPGLEQNGIYHQPGGQSGHPYSPFFKAGFTDWANGIPSPLLPGPTKHTLTLSP